MSRPPAATRTASRRLTGTALLLAVAGCNGQPPAASAPQQPAANTGNTALPAGCLPGERGFLQASLRGAIDADLDWSGAELQCDGGARPDGNGVRLSLAGPLDAAGRQVRLVFGIAVRPGVTTSDPVPVNVTVIVEDGGQLFATLGDQRCTVDSLSQQLLPNTAGSSQGARGFRVAVRGFCVDPATTLNGAERLYIDRFDLAGMARFEETELHEEPRPPTHTS